MITGDNVVWTEVSTDQGSDTNSHLWAVQEYNIGTGAISYIVSPSTATIDARSLGGAIGGQSEIVTYSVKRDTAQISGDLYTGYINQTIAAYAQTVNRDVPDTCTGHPVNCGQVHLDGPRNHAGPLLYDNGGVWKPAGVQYFEPDEGINDQTFTDKSYSDHTASRQGWLDSISNRTTGLAANLVRVFIPVAASNGGVCTSQISNANILNFLQEANDRYMRVGLVIYVTYNGGTFNGNTCAQSWLGGLLDYIGNVTPNGTGTDYRPVIAYVNAANEINNIHSRPDLVYMTNAGYKDTFDAYNPSDFGVNEEDMSSGIFQMQIVDQVVKTHSSILTTISIGTESVSTDPWFPTIDYYKSDNVPPASPCQDGVMLQYADFVTPHNYAAGAGYVYISMREGMWGYSGPMVLEEYGWPTDPVGHQGNGHNSNWNEGSSSDPCYDNQQHQSHNASMYIQCQINEFRQRTYADAVAFMVADITPRGPNCDSEALKYDLFTGLFATSGLYCGGTITTGDHMMKATGWKVRSFNLNP